MSQNADSVPAELERIGAEIAQAWPTMTGDERARLDRDEGQRVGTDLAPDAVAWVRDPGTDHADVVVWAGNNLDFDMNWPAEIRIQIHTSETDRG